tara:strand:+ start:290 stop:967 length:678 start_codon:yes stop_codon:yes gene_type:complete
MKESIKTILLFLGLILSLIFAPSCTKVTIHPNVCINGDCESQFIVAYENQEIFPNANGHYEIGWNGLEYFQVKGQLSRLNSDYCNADGIPFIETKFDSDYWVVFNNLYFTTPMYSFLGWFNNQGLNTPIPMGQYTYTMNDLIGLHPPLNVVGYQIPKHFCTECPYAPTIVGTYSKYNYEPTQNILLDDEMVGDTINIFIETKFNTEDVNDRPSKIIKTQIKVIVI